MIRRSKSAQQQLNLDIIRWQTPKERPYILPRSAQWMWDDPNRSNGDAWAFLRLGVDIYNAGDSRPQDNQLQWTSAGDGWEFRPEPVVIGGLRTYWVQRFAMTARVNLAASPPIRASPWRSLLSMDTRKTRIPRRRCCRSRPACRREGDLHIDGKLDDWAAEDLIHDGRLTKMVDRPSIQHWRLEPSSAESRIYTGWSDDDFYVAFRVGGISRSAAPSPEFRGLPIPPGLGRRFVRGFDSADLRRQFGRPRHLSRLQAQRSLHGETKAGSSDKFRPVAGNGRNRRAICRRPGQGIWTGEMAIPWRLLLNDSPNKPQLLRFNFIQHFQNTGESASWAGPIDFDQDDGFMGLLYLREFNSPGLHAQPYAR